MLPEFFYPLKAYQELERAEERNGYQVMVDDWGNEAQNVAKIRYDTFNRLEYAEARYIGYSEPKPVPDRYGNVSIWKIDIFLLPLGEKCMETIRQSLVWNSMTRTPDLAETDRYWREILSRLGKNPASQDNIFSAINKIQVPELKPLINDAILAKLSL